jgi:hypothetical protein
MKHIAFAEALIAQDKLMVAGNFICLKHLVTEKRIHQWGIADNIRAKQIATPLFSRREYGVLWGIWFHTKNYIFP